MGSLAESLNRPEIMDYEKLADRLRTDLPDSSAFKRK